MSFWQDLGSLVNVPAAALLWQAGEPGEFAVVLLEGDLEVVEEAASGDVFVLHVLEPGELAGEASCLEGALHSATLRARSACRLRRISAADLRAAVAADPARLGALLRLQSSRVRRLSRQMAALGFDPVARRVARYLLAHGGPEIRLTHQELAERVAATRESVTKALGWLRQQGLVALGRGEVRLVDRERLEDLVGED